MLAVPEFCGNANLTGALQAMSVVGTTTSSETSAFPLDVLILYEDFVTGLRAAKRLDQVRELCGGAGEIRVTLLKLDCLLQPELREEGANNAPAAEVVLMSLHGDRPLEVPIERWLMKWIGQHGDHQSALGVLFDADKQAAEPVKETLLRLEEVMRLSPADLLVGFGPSMESDAETRLEQTKQGIQPFLMATGGARGQFDGYSHWGLNE